MTRPAVVLIGPMGAGKTSIGRKAAKALHAPFFDTDIAIARAHGPIPKIFASQGEPHFRELEREAVREALATDGIVAVGGGAVLHPDTQADLTHHPVVLLTVDPATVAGRIRGTTRPLLQGEDALQSWQRVAEERGRLYAELADITIDTSVGHIRDIVDRVAGWVEEQWADAENAQKGTE
ncbi:shikimate kinase [Microbacterium protaetiae]|uniref:Shikimate kinase n=1 Tax=Microbacterium protaetiae TaxID=2509458 RepID=A0A4P6EJ01_9MICO|nr:shikimate kinase [Microbacterium protaetiae]QAY61259.1 shikimate kinase [Microbacterium protaetiae]